MLGIAPVDILLIDDDPDLSDLLHLMLMRLGARMVMTAGSAAQGRALFAAAPPSLVIIDQNLPDGLGTTLLRSLVEHEVGTDARTRFILMSGTMDAATARLAADAGATETLSKPISPKQLSESVNAALRTAAL